MLFSETKLLLLATFVWLLFSVPRISQAEEEPNPQFGVIEAYEAPDAATELD